jgi:short-subunit dehydrogenase
MRTTQGPTFLTGASSGIGRALAVVLADAGVPVGAVARRADRLAELAAEVRGKGGTIATAVADVSDRAAVATAFDQLSVELGPPARVVANAGVGNSLPADHPDHVANLEVTFRVNFLGVVYAFEAALARRATHLVAISSLAAYKGLPGAGAYSASKAAVSTYCESLRIELRGRVAVTCVCPGYVVSEMTAANPRPMPFLLPADAAARRIKRAMDRRVGVYDFPWAMRRLLWLAKWAPDGLIARRAAGRTAGVTSPGPG